MAVNWIPIRTNILTDPAVFQITRATGLTVFDAVGRLTAIWTWASEHVEDGQARVPAAVIDSLAGHTGFADAMEDAGWLITHDDYVEFPGWELWLGQSAKKRLHDARRKAASRTKAGHGDEQPADNCHKKNGQKRDRVGAPRADKSVTRPHNTTVDNTTPQPPASGGGGGGSSGVGTADPDRAKRMDALRSAGLASQKVLDRIVSDPEITMEIILAVVGEVSRTGGGPGAIANVLNDSEARQAALRKAGTVWDSKKHNAAVDARRAARQAEDAKIRADKAAESERLSSVWKKLKDDERESILRAAQARARPATLWKPIGSDSDPGKWPVLTGVFIADELRERGILPCNSS